MNKKSYKHPASILHVTPLFAFIMIAILYNFSDKIHGTNFSAYLNSQGLQFTFIGLVLGIMSGVGAVLDLPSGIISDRFGRKATGCLGMLLYGTGLLMLLFSPNIILVVTGALLIGTGMSLFSGTFFAWFKTEAKDDENLLNKGATKVSTFQWVISALAGGVAVFLLRIDGSLTFIIGGVVLILSAVIIYLWLPENYGDRKINITTMTKDSIKVILGKGSLRTIIIASVLADIALFLFIVAWQPAWLSLGNSEYTLGIMFTGLMLAASLGSYLADRMVGKKEPWQWFVAGGGLQGLGLLLVSLSSHNSLMVIGFILFEIGIGLRFAGAYALYFKLIPEDKASTVLSGISTLNSLIGFIIASGAGLLIDLYGFFISFIIGSTFAFLSCLLVYFAEKHQSSMDEQKLKSSRSDVL